MDWASAENSQRTGQVQKIANGPGNCIIYLFPLTWNLTQLWFINSTPFCDNRQFDTILWQSSIHWKPFWDNRQFDTIVWQLSNHQTPFCNHHQFDTIHWQSSIWHFETLAIRAFKGRTHSRHCSPVLHPLWGGHPPSLSNPNLGARRGMGARLNNRPCGSHTNCENFGKICEFCVKTLEILTATWWLAKQARLALPS